MTYKARLTCFHQVLSFSTKGSAKHEVVDKVVEALSIAKEMSANYPSTGELPTPVPAKTVRTKDTSI